MRLLILCQWIVKELFDVMKFDKKGKRKLTPEELESEENTNAKSAKSA